MKLWRKRERASVGPSVSSSSARQISSRAGLVPGECVWFGEAPSDAALGGVGGACFYSERISLRTREISR
eukprot:CAMPEP_0172317702 /NCGR_PEP_ID=MMETSP1058-20130122/32487_1 /TAXON_ID=83371 /ORGANISM="Detonula confervacea, Strain CCMP 353" /LENGTH=69 /DNA_ID=CAMNT_0013032321 /DNA_START=423 /DNA_END=629 /DNA_ORIENTATION=+